MSKSKSGYGLDHLLRRLAGKGGSRLIVLALILMAGTVSLAALQAFWPARRSTDTPRKVSAPPAAPRGYKPQAPASPAQPGYEQVIIGDGLPMGVNVRGFHCMMGLDQNGKPISFTLDGLNLPGHGSQYLDDKLPRFAPISDAMLAQVKAGANILEKTAQFRHTLQKPEVPAMFTHLYSERGLSAGQVQEVYPIPTDNNAAYLHCYEFQGGCGHTIMVMLTSSMEVVYANPQREARDWAASQCPACLTDENSEEREEQLQHEADMLQRRHDFMRSQGRDPSQPPASGSLGF